MRTKRTMHLGQLRRINTRGESKVTSGDPPLSLKPISTPTRDPRPHIDNFSIPPILLLLGFAKNSLL